MNSSAAEHQSSPPPSFFSGQSIPAISTGFTSGLGLLVAQVAYGSYIFSGPLAPYASQGVGLVLLGNFAACLIIAIAGGYRGAIAGLSPALVIAMAVIGSSLDAEGDVLYVTTASALIICAVVTGLCCLAVGRLRLANLVRFIPYPVTGGFVAGIGGSVCLAAMTLMGADTQWWTIITLLEPGIIWKWIPGVVYGAALYFAIKKWGNPLILPVSVLVAVVVYHLVLETLGISGDEARSAGLLLKSTTEGNLWPSLWPADLLGVDWGLMAGQAHHMVMLVVVAFISVVMNYAGLELATNEELDWDREFRVTGFASLAAGAGGCTVVTYIVPASLRSKLFGAMTRMTGVVAALVIGCALVLGDGMLEYVPAPLVGGILVFAGLGMLDEGLIKCWRRLPRLEYGIILLIFITVTTWGLLEGVGIGMIVTIVFFAVRLSRVEPIASRFTLQDRKSTKIRPVPDRAILLREGQRVRGFRLRGYLFFGSVYPLADRLKQTLSDDARPVCILVDFAAVSGYDFSAVSVLGRFLSAAYATGTRVVLCALPEGLGEGLERDLPRSVIDHLLFEQDLDHAMERCEDIVLKGWYLDGEPSAERRFSLLEHTVDDLERHLDRQIVFENLVESLQRWLIPQQYSAGEVLVGPDAPAENLQLLLAGRVSGYDASGARLFQCVPGDGIWPQDAPARKTTRVVADEPCRTMALTPDAREWLEQNRQQLSLNLYRYLLDGRLPSENQTDSS